MDEFIESPVCKLPLAIENVFPPEPPDDETVKENDELYEPVRPEIGVVMLKVELQRA